MKSKVCSLRRLKKKSRDLQLDWPRKKERSAQIIKIRKESGNINIDLKEIRGIIL